MWRRTFFCLLLVRLYFALSPSYLHPDENFQGPEVIAGQIFSYPVKLTWEFTSEYPVRSIFPLWLVYGLPMLLLRWIWVGNGKDDELRPVAVFWALRVLMFVLSFVLEDWAIHELVQSPRHRETALLLVASSYVTWTYQMHTFSNSIETLLVAWCLVLIQRIVADKQRTSPLASSTLAFLVVFGVFNRITFPAFLFIPGLRLIPHFAKKPLTLIIMAITALVTLFIAVSLDTNFYTRSQVTLLQILTHPVLTPLNNLSYNFSSSNLALHGLHPWYQHVLANLPLLIGPAFVLLFLQPHFSLRLYAAISGVIALSLFQHQEARFLLPAVPLILTSLQLPQNKIWLRAWVGAWITFNVIFGILMGIYHQGGVIPAQVFLSQQSDATQAIWWKTYSPPIWLLNGKNKVLQTHDLMGMKGDLMVEEIGKIAPCYIPRGNQSNEGQNGTYLVAPMSEAFLDQYTVDGKSTAFRFSQVWNYRQHLSLDDLDFGDDGIWPTIQKVVGRRGLAIWRVTKDCSR